MRIGLIVSRRGPSGLWALTCDTSAMLAAAEINARGGVQERPVELVLADTGLVQSEAAYAARALVEVDEVDAIVGMHPSHLRGSIAQAIAGRVPYVYAPMYEGGEQSRNVLPIGATDDELLGHAVPQLMQRRRAQRFFVLGNDYVWPQQAAAAAARVVARHGGHLVGSRLVRFGAPDYGEVLAEIARSAAQVVITLLLGEESVRFNRAFAACGMAARVLRLGLGIDETVLYGGGQHAHENLYAATTYVAPGAARDGDRFVELYRANFGSAVPPPTVFGKACYDGVHLLAGLAPAGGRAQAGVAKAGGLGTAGSRPVVAGLGQQFSQLAKRLPLRHTLPPTLIDTARVHLAEAQGLELRVLAPC